MRSKVVRYDSMSSLSVRRVRSTDCPSFLDLRSSFLDKSSTIRSKCFAMAPNRFSFSSAEWVRSASRLRIISRRHLRDHLRKGVGVSELHHPWWGQWAVERG